MGDALVPVEEALGIVLDGVAALDTEMVALTEAEGRVLARNVAAARTQPPFDVSAMDGYAVRGADLAALPVELRVIGESAAGHRPTHLLGPGEAMRIFTGAPMPEGADSVVLQEDVRRVDDRVVVPDGVQTGRHVRRRGLDFREGDVALRAGQGLDPVRLALAASMNHARLPVVRRPRLALLATGDELSAPGDDLPSHAIVASNVHAIAAIARSHGAVTDDLGIVGDRLDAIVERLDLALDRGADIVVSTGGASVGDHDLIRPAFRAIGVEPTFTKVAIRPGKPLVFGTLERDGRRIRLFGVAGNPVSSIVATLVFIAPLIDALGGRQGRRGVFQGLLAAPLAANDGRQDHLRARAWIGPDGTTHVQAFERQDSSMLRTLAEAEALIIRPPKAPALPAGAAVPCLSLRAASAERPDGLA